MTVITESLLLRVNEVANLLGISRSAVYRLIGSNQIQAVQVNERSVRIARSEVARYVESLLTLNDSREASPPTEADLIKGDRELEFELRRRQ